MSIPQCIKQDNIENFNTNLQGGAVDAGQSHLHELQKVFIANKSGHNFRDSERYGEPIYVTTGEINRFSVGYMARKWMTCLIDSSPKDYILITSLTILTVVGAAIFGWIHGSINVLLFRNNKYILRTVNFRDLYCATLENRKEKENDTF